jgi:hypothetical protein
MITGADQRPAATPLISMGIASVDKIPRYVCIMLLKVLYYMCYMLYNMFYLIIYNMLHSMSYNTIHNMLPLLIGFGRTVSA